MDVSRLDSQSRLALCAELVDGKRVLELGGLGAESGASLIEFGARSVTATRTAIESRGGRTRLIDNPTCPLSFRDNEFDVVICHDLAERLAQDTQWLDELRRVLTDDGYLITAVAQEDGESLSDIATPWTSFPTTYEDFYGDVAETFGAPAVFAQAPLTGSLFYDLESEEEDPALEMDRSLVRNDEAEPGWIVMVFGPEKWSREGLHLIQLTHGDVVAEVDAHRAASEVIVEDPGASEELERAQRDLETLRRRHEQATRELNASEEIINNLKSEIGAATSTSEEQLRAARAELENSQARIGAMERELEIATEALEAQRAHESTLIASFEAQQAEEEVALRVIAQQESTLREVRRQYHAMEEALSQAQLLTTQFHALEDAERNLRGRLASAQQQADEKGARLGEVEQELARVQQESQAQVDELIQTTESQLSAAKQEADARVQAIQDELGTLQQALAQNQEQLSVAAGEQERRTQEFEALRIHGEEQTEALRNELEQQQARHQEALAEREEALESLQTQTSNLFDELEETKSELGEAKSELGSARNELEETKTQLGGHQTELEETKAELERVASSAEEARELKQQLDQVHEINRTLNGDVEQLRVRETELLQKLATTEGELVEVTGREKTFHDAAEAHAEELKKLETLVAETQVERDQLHMVLMNQQEELDTFRKDKSAADVTITEQDTRLQELETRLKSLQGRFQSLETERDNLATEAQRLTDALHAAENRERSIATEEAPLLPQATTPPELPELPERPQESYRLQEHDATTSPQAISPDDASQPSEEAPKEQLEEIEGFLNDILPPERR